MRGTGQTPKDMAERGVKRGRLLSDSELRVIAALPRSKGRQLLCNDITTGYQLERTLGNLGAEWLRKNG